jgi:hypothetical protein
MSRRFYVLAATALAATTMAHAAENAADRVCTREAMPRVFALRPEVAAVFAHPDQSKDVVETANGSSAPMGPLEVVMIRKGKDGNLTFACVNRAEAAQRFLDGTADGAAKAKEK